MLRGKAIVQTGHRERVAISGFLTYQVLNLFVKIESRDCWGSAIMAQNAATNQGGGAEIFTYESSTMLYGMNWSVR